MSVASYLYEYEYVHLHTYFSVSTLHLLTCSFDRILWERNSGSGGAQQIEGRAGYRVLAQSDELDPDIETGTALSLYSSASTSASDGTSGPRAPAPAPASASARSGYLVELDLGVPSFAPTRSTSTFAASTSRPYLNLSHDAGAATDTEAEAEGEGNLSASDARLVENAVAQLRQGGKTRLELGDAGSCELPPFSTTSTVASASSSNSLAWHALFTHSALWAIYCAHFASNWLNYIIASWSASYIYIYI